MDPKEMAEYTLTVQEAAQIIGVTGARVRQYIAQKRLPAIMRAGAWFLRPDEVRAFRPRPRGKPPKK